MFLHIIPVHSSEDLSAFCHLYLRKNLRCGQAKGLKKEGRLFLWHFDLDMFVYSDCRFLGVFRPIHRTLGTYLGSTSQPCCMKAPRENHRLLPMVKSLDSFASPLSTFHSSELNRLTRNSTTLTPMKAKTVHSQISCGETDRALGSNMK